MDAMGKRATLTQERFVQLVKEAHGDYYDLSSSVYSRSKDKVEVVCRIHGKFLIRAAHLMRGHGCKKCGISQRGKLFRKPEEYYISQANSIHEYKYSYSNFRYEKGVCRVDVTCNTHGTWSCYMQNHLRGNGCPSCYEENRGKFLMISQDDFLIKARKVWGDTCDYSMTEYSGRHGYIIVRCIAHDFTYRQMATNHLAGYRACIYCASISKGEAEIARILDDNGISYFHNQRFSDLGPKMSFDFYIPGINTTIEFDGIQHFEPIDFFGGKESFDRQQERDALKNAYAERVGMRLVRIPYSQIDNIQNILTECGVLE